MAKQYIFRSLENLVEPCISGIISEDDRGIIIDTKIHIPENYFKKKGTYEVVPTNNRLPHPTNFQLYNGGVFGISRVIFSGLDNVPFYLYKNDRILLFDNTDARNAGDKHKPILDKEARELIDLSTLLVSGGEENVKAEVAEPDTNILKTKALDMRKIGRNIIPILYRSV